MKACWLGILIVCMLGILPHSATAQDDAPALTLTEAMRFALRQNLDLRSAHDRVLSANIALETNKAEFRLKIRPEVSGEFQPADTVTENYAFEQNYGLRIDRQLTTGGELNWRLVTRVDERLDEKYQTDLRVGYTQPLLRGRGKLAATSDLTTAAENVRSQERGLILAQQRLMISVAAAYYNILRDEMLIEMNARALERAALLQQAAEAKLQVGMASKMDVFRAELQLLNAQNAAVEAAAALESERQEFNLLLGVPLESVFRLSSPLAYAPTPLAKDELLASAHAHRLEIAEARQNVAAAERRVTMARQNLAPPLDVSVYYTLRGQGAHFDESVGVEDKFWGVGVSSAFAFDFAQERAAQQQAELALETARRNLQATQDSVTVDVLRTITNVRQAEASVKLQEQSVWQAEKQLELAALRYKKGLSDNLDVVNAEEAVLKTKTSYYAALVQHLIATMRLQYVAGVFDVPFE